MGGGPAPRPLLALPGLFPVVDGSRVAERHRVGPDVSASAHAAHERPDPGTSFDAMDGPAPLPLRLGWEVEVPQVVILFRPRTRPRYVLARFNRHGASCPSRCSSVGLLSAGFRRFLLSNRNVAAVAVGRNSPGSGAVNGVERQLRVSKVRFSISHERRGRSARRAHGRRASRAASPWLVRVSRPDTARATHVDLRPAIGPLEVGSTCSPGMGDRTTRPGQVSRSPEGVSPRWRNAARAVDNLFKFSPQRSTICGKGPICPWSGENRAPRLCSNSLQPVDSPA